MGYRYIGSLASKSQIKTNYSNDELHNIGQSDIP